MLEKKEKRYRRHKRVRAKIFGKKEKPRLCVFRSAKHIYAQIIDDERGKTMVSASDLELKKHAPYRTKGSGAVVKDKAKEVGKLIAKRGLKKQLRKWFLDGGVINNKAK